MLQSRMKPRASCAAAASSRLAPRCRTAVLPRPAGATNTAAPTYASRHSTQQLQQQVTRSSRPAPSRFVPARCFGTGSGADVSNSSGPEGAARSGRDLPLPAGDANAATGGGSSPKQPADADAPPMDAMSSRQRQAAEAVLPLLQEALRPLVEGQADVLAAFRAFQQQQVHRVKGMVEQQQQQHQEQQQQFRQEQQQQMLLLAAFQRQGELLRQLLATACTASGVPSQAVAGPAAIRAAPWQLAKQAPKLLDYVRINSDRDGIVLGIANCGARVKVRCITGGAADRVFEDRVLEVIAECDLLRSSDRVQYLPYDPKGKGVPVTRFTAAPGMLVRRGYDVRKGEEREAADGEVGVLQPYPGMGDTCLVEWTSGSQMYCETGWGGRFELVHLEMSRTSGAPVVGEDWTGKETTQRGLLVWGGSELQQPEHLCIPQAAGGTAVERGTHWVYGGSEPGVGCIYATARARRAETKAGKVPVKWLNGQMLHYYAFPGDGYDLSYSARPGDLVTPFTAREGLEVEATAANGAPMRGVLVRPESIRGHSVLWQVKLSGYAKPVTYAVESSRATPGRAPTDSGSPDVAELRFV